MTPNWLDDHKRYNAKFDHKLIGQIRVRLVGGIRTTSDRLN